MGLTFLGNPYEEEEYEDEGWDITADEEDWIQPNNVEMLGVFRLVPSDLMESDWQTLPVDLEEEQDDTDNDDEDWRPEDYDLSHDDDEDDDGYNPDDEDYEAEEEVLDFDAGQRFIPAGDEDDDDEDLDYVTFDHARFRARQTTSPVPSSDLSTDDSEKTTPTTSTSSTADSEKTTPTTSTSAPNSSQSNLEEKTTSRGTE
ncbi:unnamed protein product [Acanthoscelides obtectus]|uniref:Uncharacterized protein n=1 Tax=Acanthoscelides obtectus TaxID=200917 RepID=A0A9P0LYD7_ACAOB|nr:unnamed protein product [Acanthoscelides obtectus]CAK1637662.1 hypothetical protein AOBTE_LOCUS10121 [Acanthoscelides obtectus]